MSESVHPLLRLRDGHHAHVTYEELFFDLVYVFAVTQLSHALLHHLTAWSALETLVLWFAVWLGWQYTCWVTNWFNPEQLKIRLVLFGCMALALVMAASIPDAFGAGGLIFAGCYVAMQLGRTSFIVWQLGRGHPLAANYRRMLGWLTLSACFWIGGAVAEGEARLALWIVAALCEYVSPMIGFALLGMGRSHVSDWTIEGGHLAERCQLFVIVALGESLLATGATLAGAENWNIAELSAMLATFLGTIAMWWLYFGTSSKDATARITQARDPGKIGAYFHYIHAILIFGIIVSAVGNDLAMEHPAGHASVAQIVVIAVGPAIYLIGSAIYKYVVYGRLPLSHIGGVVLLALIAPFAQSADLLTLGWLTTAVLFGIGLWESRTRSEVSLNEGGVHQ
ncbi:MULTISPECIES: low temperature requirement protein A [Brucella]|uniref:Probable transmembrane protein n=1 Tax=Ochrobactrum soli TaxID=2448455 RepID=A0A2P9HB14_9HYPH|nr:MULTISPECIES: low temperature requirement protein A [Brucella]MCI0999218.1 low temperature requirement protein A [Ochrobactrum sp. C6C9]MDX4072903.1 low temperature requirement protein A [Brucella sp. NBRC 113783]SPL61293.1 Probable transmembrane protein [[Ochrobactrum] soli]